MKKLRKDENKRIFYSGMKDAIPIGIGYFAVSFSLGIAARNAGLTAFQSFLASLLCNASAGEYIGFTLIGIGATYAEVAIMTLVANMRYILMSCAIGQKISPDTKLRHRLMISSDLTDEIFSISMAKDGYINPFYVYGAIITAAPCWALGTLLGNIAGNLLPLRIVSALGVALYGMFIAVIVAPSRKNKILAVLVVSCFIISFASLYIPFIKDIPEGTRTIILTLVLSSVFAIAFPKNDGEVAQNE